MVYVKLVRQSMEKTTMEMLNTKRGITSEEFTDCLLLTKDYCSNSTGYRITQEDLEYLYEKKKKEREKSEIPS